jgi:DNA modification methylase
MTKLKTDKPDPKVEVLPIEQGATPDPNNVNKHTQRGRGLHENSMRKRGAGRSIFSAGKGVDVPVVMGGNQTLEIAAQLDMEIINVHTTGNQVVNVVRDDIEPGSAEFYAMGIEDNEIGKQSYNPDLDILAAVMADPAMQLLKDEDRILAGIVEGMGLKDDLPEAPEAQMDKADQLLEKWKVKTGDLWQIGDHRLICGDCTDEAVVERVMGGETAGMMVTDPPYGVEYDPSWRQDAAEKGLIGFSPKALGKVENDNIVDWEAARKLFGGNVAYVWYASLKHAEVEKSLHEFEIRSQIIWAKSSFAISRGHYHWQHECCLYAVRKGNSAKFIGDRSQSTLWSIPNGRQGEDVHTEHGTQKPLLCMERPIKNHDFQIIYEPFSGSGTTLVACERLHRKGRAIEIAPKYVAVALERLSQMGLTPKLIK